MSRYRADGKNLSSMVHATRGEDCSICGKKVFGNGGKVSHGRAHVRRGEAVELEKYYGYDMGYSRFFFVPGDEHIERFLADGYYEVSV